MKNNTPSNKLLLEIIPGTISSRNMPELFSGDRMKHLRESNINTALILTSEPVDSRTYLAMINALKAAGIRVMSLYYNPAEDENLDGLRAAVADLQQTLANGGCIIISYMSPFGPALIAAMHVASGKNIDDAITAVARVVPDSGDLHRSRGLLSRFAEHLLHSPDASPGIRNAVRIQAAAADDRHPAESSPVIIPAASGSPAPEHDAANRPVPAKKADAGARADAKAAPVKKATQKTAALPSDRSAPFYRSIRFKLISIISFIIMASLSGMIFLASHYFKRDNDVRVRENNIQMADVIATKIRAEIEKYQLITAMMLKEKKSESIAGYENLIRTGENEMLFAGIVKASPRTGTQALAKTYRNRTLMNRFLISEKDIDTLNAAVMKSLAASFAGEHTVTNVSPHLNHLVFALSFPYERNAAGAVQSAMVSYIRLDNLMKTFNNAGITKVFMVNYRGDVIAHPEANYVQAGANFANLPICAMMMKSKMDNGQTRYKDDAGIYFLGSFKKIALGGFGVIAAAEEKKAFQAVYDIQRRNLIIMGIMLTLAILFIFFFGKTITTPIIRLVGATRQIIAGQYEVDIVPTSKDEIGHLTSTFIEMGKGLAEREKIKSAFGKFVNKEVAEAALRDELRLGGERKTVAILFSDIRAFTSISEKLDPEEVVEFLNEYITRMVNCVNITRGVVDKFIGDAIMAVWGAPVSYGNDTEHAIEGALMMRNELIGFNRERGGPRKPIIHIGCGINTGIVLAGQIGSEERMEYTVIGDAVNLASRIEALNKPFGTDILISEDSYRLVKDTFAVEKMRTIRVKGKIEPQQIYAVLGRIDDPRRPKSVKELRDLVGLDPKDLSEDAMTDILEHGEEKYEIIEK